jgi:hypothetical protein
VRQFSQLRSYFGLGIGCVMVEWWSWGWKCDRSCREVDVTVGLAEPKHNMTNNLKGTKTHHVFLLLLPLLNVRSFQRYSIAIK